MTYETLKEILREFGVNNISGITQVYTSAWSIDGKYIQSAILIRLSLIKAFFTAAYCLKRTFA
ncbi:MAG TPA: hypothetical protein PLZ84_00115 [Clostridia bacterium]|nr:hypothetical protein [Clostridia bacterium]